MRPAPSGGCCEEKKKPALGRLFDDVQDPVNVIKWKELYDTLERTLDSAEDVANVLESVTIKHG